MTPVLDLLACATCKTDPNTALGQAANGAIYVMFGAMTIVFGGFSAVIVSFVRKQRAIGRKLAAASAPDAPLSAAQPIS